MKILHLDEARIWGGAENQLLLIHEGLVRRGHESFLMISPKAPLGDRVRSRGWDWIEFEPLFEVDVGSAYRLVRAFRRLAPDIVHAHTPRSHAIARLAQLVEPDMPLIVSRQVNLPLPSHAFSRLKYRVGVRRYICVSNAVKDTMIRGGVQPELLRVVHSSAAILGSGSKATAGPVPHTEFRWGLVGRLEAIKRPQDAIDAAAEFRRMGIPAKLLIAGAGDLTHELQERARHLVGSGCAKFLGHVTDMNGFLSGLDAMVMCSENEGCPNVILEAMAAGVPVVTTPVGGIPELTEDGKTALWFPVGDVHALVGCLRRLMDDPALGRRLAEHASVRVQTEFSSDSMVDKIVSVYAEVQGCS